MTDMDKKVDVVIKAWDTAQAVARSCDESANKLRGLAFSGWGLLLAFAYTKRDPLIYVIALALLLLACFSEAMIRQVQYAFIRRSFEIEKSLEAYMVDDVSGFIAASITTHVPAMTWCRFWQIFSWHRSAVWGPYLIAITATIAACLFAERGA